VYVRNSENLFINRYTSLTGIPVELNLYHPFLGGSAYPDVFSFREYNFNNAPFYLGVLRKHTGEIIFDDEGQPQYSNGYKQEFIFDEPNLLPFMGGQGYIFLVNKAGSTYIYKKEDKGRKGYFEPVEKAISQNIEVYKLVLKDNNNAWHHLQFAPQNSGWQRTAWSLSFFYKKLDSKDNTSTFIVGLIAPSQSNASRDNSNSNSNKIIGIPKDGLLPKARQEGAPNIFEIVNNKEVGKLIKDNTTFNLYEAKIENIGALYQPFSPEALPSGNIASTYARIPKGGYGIKLPKEADKNSKFLEIKKDPTVKINKEEKNYYVLEFGNTEEGVFNLGSMSIFRGAYYLKGDELIFEEGTWFVQHVDLAQIKEELSIRGFQEEIGRIGAGRNQLFYKAFLRDLNSEEKGQKKEVKIIIEREKGNLKGEYKEQSVIIKHRVFDFVFSKGEDPSNWLQPIFDNTGKISGLTVKDEKNLVYLPFEFSSQVFKGKELVIKYELKGLKLTKGEGDSGQTSKALAKNGRLYIEATEGKHLSLHSPFDVKRTISDTDKNKKPPENQFPPSSYVAAYNPPLPDYSSYDLTVYDLDIKEGQNQNYKPRLYFDFYSPLEPKFGEGSLIWLPPGEAVSANQDITIKTKGVVTGKCKEEARIMNMGNTPFGYIIKYELKEVSPRVVEVKSRLEYFGNEKVYKEIYEGEVWGDVVIKQPVGENNVEEIKGKIPKTESFKYKGIEVWKKEKGYFLPQKGKGLFETLGGKIYTEKAKEGFLEIGKGGWKEGWNYVYEGEVKEGNEIGWGPYIKGKLEVSDKIGEKIEKLERFQYLLSQSFKNKNPVIIINEENNNNKKINNNPESQKSQTEHVSTKEGLPVTPTLAVEQQEVKYFHNKKVLSFDKLLFRFDGMDDEGRINFVSTLDFKGTKIIGNPPIDEKQIGTKYYIFAPQGSSVVYVIEKEIVEKEGINFSNKLPDGVLTRIKTEDGKYIKVVLPKGVIDYELRKKFNSLQWFIDLFKSKKEVEVFINGEWRPFKIIKAHLPAFFKEEKDNPAPSANTDFPPIQQANQDVGKYIFNLRKVTSLVEISIRGNTYRVRSDKLYTSDENFKPEETKFAGEKIDKILDPITGNWISLPSLYINEKDLKEFNEVKTPEIKNIMGYFGQGIINYKTDDWLVTHGGKAGVIGGGDAQKLFRYLISKEGYVELYNAYEISKSLTKVERIEFIVDTIDIVWTAGEVLYLLYTLGSGTIALPTIEGAKHTVIEALKYGGKKAARFILNSVTDLLVANALGHYFSGEYLDSEENLRVLWNSVLFRYGKIPKVMFNKLFIKYFPKPTSEVSNQGVKMLEDATKGFNFIRKAYQYALPAEALTYIAINKSSMNDTDKRIASHILFAIMLSTPGVTSLLRKAEGAGVVGLLKNIWKATKDALRITDYARGTWKNIALNSAIHVVRLAYWGGVASVIFDKPFHLNLSDKTRQNLGLGLFAAGILVPGLVFKGRITSPWYWLNKTNILGGVGIYLFGDKMGLSSDVSKYLGLGLLGLGIVTRGIRLNISELRSMGLSGSNLGKVSLWNLVNSTLHVIPSLAVFNIFVALAQNYAATHEGWFAKGLGVIFNKQDFSKMHEKMLDELEIQWRRTGSEAIKRQFDELKKMGPDSAKFIMLVISSFSAEGAKTGLWFGPFMYPLRPILYPGLRGIPILGEIMEIWQDTIGDCIFNTDKLGLVGRFLNSMQNFFIEEFGREPIAGNIFRVVLSKIKLGTPPMTHKYFTLYNLFIEALQESFDKTSVMKGNMEGGFYSGKYPFHKHFKELNEFIKKYIDEHGRLPNGEDIRNFLNGRQLNDPSSGKSSKPTRGDIKAFLKHLQDMGILDHTGCPTPLGRYFLDGISAINNNGEQRIASVIASDGGAMTSAQAQQKVDEIRIQLEKEGVVPDVRGRTKEGRQFRSREEYQKLINAGYKIDYVYFMYIDKEIQGNSGRRGLGYRKVGQNGERITYLVYDGKPDTYLHEIGEMRVNRQQELIRKGEIQLSSEVAQNLRNYSPHDYVEKVLGYKVNNNQLLPKRQPIIPPQLPTGPPTEEVNVLNVQPSCLQIPSDITIFASDGLKKAEDNIYQSLFEILKDAISKASSDNKLNKTRLQEIEKKITPENSRYVFLFFLHHMPEAFPKEFQQVAGLKESYFIGARLEDILYLTKYFLGRDLSKKEKKLFTKKS
ncbi:MAG: hypothetical protein NC826_05820, partial [Candidatus Omnitrophica bacterium]|nr:hypothetical protein [Candidatus Omnitrophota bacterium]